MRRLIGSGLLVVAVGAAGCSASNSGSPAKPSPGQTSTPSSAFTSAKFQPRVSFSLGREWTNPVVDEVDTVFLYAGPSNAGAVPELNILRVARVYDPKTGKPAPAPADIIGWLRKNTYLTVGASAPVQIAGYPGTQVDVVERKGPKRAAGPFACHNPPNSCLRLFQQRCGESLAVALGE